MRSNEDNNERNRLNTIITLHARALDLSGCFSFVVRHVSELPVAIRELGAVKELLEFVQDYARSHQVSDHLPVGYGAFNRAGRNATRRSGNPAVKPVDKPLKNLISYKERLAKHVKHMNVGSSITPRDVSAKLGCSPKTAASSLSAVVDMGLLEKRKVKKSERTHNRQKYIYVRIDVREAAA